VIVLMFCVALRAFHGLFGLLPKLAGLNVGNEIVGPLGSLVERSRAWCTFPILCRMRAAVASSRGSIPAVPFPCLRPITASLAFRIAVVATSRVAFNFSPAAFSLFGPGCIRLPHRRNPLDDLLVHTLSAQQLRHFAPNVGASTAVLSCNVLLPYHHYCTLLVVVSLAFAAEPPAHPELQIG
jgi:hypothetical protein